jgi:hypothetical protein
VELAGLEPATSWVRSGDAQCLNVSILQRVSGPNGNPQGRLPLIAAVIMHVAVRWASCLACGQSPSTRLSSTALVAKMIELADISSANQSERSSIRSTKQDPGGDWDRHQYLRS